LFVGSQLAGALPALPRAEPGRAGARAALPGASTLQCGRGAGLGARGRAPGLAQLGETEPCAGAAALLMG